MSFQADRDNDFAFDDGTTLRIFRTSMVDGAVPLKRTHGAPEVAA
jgi:hypothetical protein